MVEQNNHQQTAPANFNAANDNAVGLQLTDILELYLHNWKWFVLSVIVFMIGAFISVKRSTPIYTRTAQILIKEEGTRGSFSGNVDWFASLGMGSNAVNVQNELVAIQSPSMFVEVVKRLNLNTRYQTEGHWHAVSLYGKTLPVKVEFLDLGTEKSGSLTLTLSKDGRVVLSDFYGSDESVALRIGQTARTPLGRIRVLATPAITQLADADDHIKIYVSHTDLMSAARSVAGGLSANVDNKENSIIDLTYADSNTERAEDIIRVLIDAYNDSWVEDKNKMAKATNEFIMERLKVIQNELQDVDNAISSYKSENLVPDPATMAGIYVSDAKADDKKIVELNNNLYMTRYMRSFVTKEANKFSLLPANSGMGASAIESQIAEYNTLLLDRNRLLANTSAQHPLIQEKDKALAQMRAAIVTSIDNQINLIETHLRSTAKTQAESKTGIANSPQQAKFLVNVERQQKVKEALYVFLLQKREETELSQAFTAYNTRLITPPLGSNTPVSPQRNRMFLIALALALAIPAGILYLLEISNTRVRGKKDVEGMSVPFIGEIPFVGHQRKHNLDYWLKRFGLRKQKEVKEVAREIVIKPHSRNIINEAFRVVRTNLDFVNAVNAEDAGGQLIMVTSANPGSGKTYVSSNLAVSYALKDKKTLILDFDLRRASASLYVNSPKNGVSNYLIGKTDNWQELVVPLKDHENTYILPVGTLPPNPAELLAGPRTAQLFQELRQEYDLIFVDCPPVEIVADAAIISKLVDQTIFVVRVDLMEREMLPVIDNYYTQKKFPGMCVLLNGSISAYGRYGYHRYGYRYGYGYGYSYGYGYGNGYTHEES